MERVTGNNQLKLGKLSDASALQASSGSAGWKRRVEARWLAGWKTVGSGQMDGIILTTPFRERKLF